MRQRRVAAAGRIMMHRNVDLAGVAVGAALSRRGVADAATAKRAAFGTLADGTAIEAVTLTGSERRQRAHHDAMARRCRRSTCPIAPASVADVTLGYDDLASYVDQPNYWGQTIGRYANRIAGGRFTLDGKTYQLHAQRQDQLAARRHVGFDKRVVADRRRSSSGPAGERRAGADQPRRRSGLSRQARRHRHLRARRRGRADHRLRRDDATRRRSST